MCDDPINVEDQYVIAAMEKVVSSTKQITDSIDLRDDGDDFMVQDKRITFNYVTNYIIK